MKFIKNEYIIKDNIKLSNLSKRPPCPGKISLEFFNELILLNFDSKRSPKKAAIIVDKIKKIIVKSIFNPNVFRYIKAEKKKNYAP